MRAISKWMIEAQGGTIRREGEEGLPGLGSSQYR